MKVLPLAVLALIGCLPAYDNALAPATTDLGNVDIGGSTDGPTCGPSGKFIAGITYSAESGLANKGVVVNLEGYDDPKFVSQPSDSLGHFKFEIPDCVFGTGRYLIQSGSATSTPMLRTWIAPAKFGTEELPESTATHFYENPADQTKGSRHLVLKELVAAGLFASEEDFKAKYHYTQSTLVSVSGGLTRYNGYTVQVKDNGMPVDNTGCNMPGKAATQCCIFYLSGLYFDFINGRSGPTYVKLNDTKAAGYNFVMTCPGNGTTPGVRGREVTLTQTQPTASLMDSFGNPPNADFPPVVVPVVVGDVVGLEWYIFL